MSGVGEVLAIVSCVAGLIQAYDAGSRIVKQIKQRRQAHGALPPSDLLEESIEKGRTEIIQLVKDGNKRFGPSFEEGDSESSPNILPHPMSQTPTDIPRSNRPDGPYEGHYRHPASSIDRPDSSSGGRWNH